MAERLPFGRMLGLKTQERPAPSPTQLRPEPARKNAPEKLKKHTGRNIALVGTAGLTFVGGAVYAAYENIPAVHRLVDSAFLDHLRGSSEAETKKVNPKEIFDPNAKEIVITSNNSVLFIEDGHEAPPTIDLNKPDAATITLPLKLNVEDGKPVKLKLKRQSGYIGGGHVLGSERHINSRLEHMEDGRWDYTREGQINDVFDTLIIEEGLTIGSELAFFYDADDLHDVTIERLGGEKADEGQVLRTEGFVIKAFNNRNYPNEYGKTGDYIQIVIGVDSSMQLVKDMPPSTTGIVEHENGTKGYRNHSTPVPLGSGESFVRITKPSKSKYYNGQAMISISSRVKQSDGIINGGAAELILENNNNKFVLIINKPKQETTFETSLK